MLSLLTRVGGYAVRAAGAAKNVYDWYVSAEEALTALGFLKRAAVTAVAVGAIAKGGAAVAPSVMNYIQPPTPPQVGAAAPADDSKTYDQEYLIVHPDVLKRILERCRSGEETVLERCDRARKAKQEIEDKVEGKRSAERFKPIPIQIK